MSKYVKDLMTKDLARRLEGAEDCLVVNVVGMEANDTVELRRQLREKNINLMVVKNSMARRATAEKSLQSLAPAFEGLKGNSAVVWGAEDFVTLVKEVVKLDKDAERFKVFEARGGVMDGEQLTKETVHQIAKWPNRAEQLSLLVGQILGPGSQLAAQLNGPGGALASQVEEAGEKNGDG